MQASRQGRHFVWLASRCFGGDGRVKVINGMGAYQMKLCVGGRLCKSDRTTTLQTKVRSDQGYSDMIDSTAMLGRFIQ